MTNLALHHAVDINVPIACAGVAIYPGDVLVGDEDGVICVPQHLADAIVIECLEMEGIEDFITNEVRNGAPLRNIYPPNEATRERYRIFKEGINTNA
jgi:regulator of RNase E activity RraA